MEYTELELVLQSYGKKNRSAHIYDDFIHVRVEVVKIDGGQVRLRFIAPRDIAIDRDVVYRRKMETFKHGELEHEPN